MDANRYLRTDIMIRNCYAVHMALLAMGFSGEDIYVVQALNAVVQLNAQGRTFKMNLGYHEAGTEEFVRRWGVVSNALVNDQVDMELCESIRLDVRILAAMVVAIQNKGIRCPGRAN